MTDKRYLVTVVEWLAYDLVISAPDAETARKHGLSIWNKDDGQFQFADAGHHDILVVDLPCFEVQTRMLSGWENCWTDNDGNPITFATLEEAHKEISEHLTDVAHAVDAHDMVEEYSRDDFRVVPITGNRGAS